MRFWLYLKHFSETFSILRITERDMIENVRWSSCILSVNSCQTLKKLEIFDRFSKNIETQKFMKLFPVRAELFLSDGQTDMTKLTGSVRNFAKGLTDNHRVCAMRTLSELNFNIQEVHVLTFRNLASHIQDGRKITLQMPHFIFIQQISVRNILNALYNLHSFLFKMPFIS